MASGIFQAQHGYYPQVVWLLTNQARAGRLAEQIAADQTLTPGLFKITAAPEQLAALIQRGGVEYVITAGWPTPNLTTTEADAVVDQLAQAGTYLVCLNSWRPGDGEPPAWWNDEEGAWMRQLDALREQDRREREQSSEHTETSKEVHHA